MNIPIPTATCQCLTTPRTPADDRKDFLIKVLVLIVAVLVFAGAYAIIRWSQHSWGLVMGGHHCVLTGVCWEVIYILLHARLEYH